MKGQAINLRCGMNEYVKSYEDEMVDLDNQFNEMDAQLSKLERSNSHNLSNNQDHSNN